MKKCELAKNFILLCKLVSIAKRVQILFLKSLSFPKVGSSGCGKSSAVKALAKLAEKPLRTLPVTSAMDTTDILGGFEQVSFTLFLQSLGKIAKQHL